MHPTGTECALLTQTGRQKALKNKIRLDRYDALSYDLCMKVTALIPDDLIAEVRDLTAGKTITDSLMIALKEWIALQKIKQTRHKIKARPLAFREDFSANKVRSLNRQK